MNIVAVCNFKGGVAKTTTTVAESVAISQMGHRVIAVDLDRTQFDSYSHYEGNLGNVVTRTLTPGRLPRLITSAAKKFDFMLLDTPPALGKEAVAALRAASLVIVPVPPAVLDARGLGRFVEVIAAARQERRAQGGGDLQTIILPVRMDGTNERAREIIGQFHAAFRTNSAVDLWPYPIPYSEPTMEANDYGQSVVTFAPDSEAAQIYIGLAQHIVQYFGKSNAKNKLTTRAA